MRSNSPMSISEIKSHAPAVFSDGPAERVSERYDFIPTFHVLEAMLEAGYGVARAQQKHTHAQANMPFTRHLLAFRPLKAFSHHSVGDAIPEVMLINEHTGGGAFHLYAGVYRLICLNGMVVGDTFESVRIIHRGTAAQEVVSASNKMWEFFPKLNEQVEAMQEYKLTPVQQGVFARRAMDIRFGKKNHPFVATELLMCRRQEDQGISLWHVFNRVQENAMRGGIQGLSANGRRVTTRPVERVTKDVMWNRQLWDAAVSYLPEAA